MDDPVGWDFEGQVTFLEPDQGRLAGLPRMGYFPSFRYPEFDGATQFLARPVEGFRANGRPYDDLEQLDSTFVVFRFRFLDRDRFETLHRPRLVPGRRFELMEGFRRVAYGTVVWRREEMPRVQDEIERLIKDLGANVPPDDVKEALTFLYHSEWECAVNLLWATLSIVGHAVGREFYALLVAVSRQVGMDLPRMEREFPIRHL